MKYEEIDVKRQNRLFVVFLIKISLIFSYKINLFFLKIHVDEIKKNIFVHEIKKNIFVHNKSILNKNIVGLDLQNVTYLSSFNKIFHYKIRIIEF